MKSIQAGALMLCSIVMMGTMTGCSNASVSKAVSLVASEMPAVESGVAAAAALVSAVDPALAPIVIPVNAIAQAALPQLQALLQQYAANPNASIFASIESVVDKIVTDGDTALLAASKISNPASQAKATAILASLDAMLHVLDGFISQVQTPAQVKAKTSARLVKLQQVSAYWSQNDKNTVAAAFHAPYSVVYDHAIQAGF